MCEESVLPEPETAQIVTISETETNTPLRSDSTVYSSSSISSCIHVPPSSVGVDAQTDRDCVILQSILNDDHYEIAEEDRAALQAVINSLSLQQCHNSFSTTDDDNGMISEQEMLKYKRTY